MQFSTSINGLNAFQLQLLQQQNEQLTAKEVGIALASFGLVTIVIPAMAGSSVPNYYLNEDGAKLLNVIFGSEVEVA